MRRSEFCRSRGLSPGTLRRRLEGGKQGARQTPQLVAVELEEKAVQKAKAIEVVLGRGRRVEVRPGLIGAAQRVEDYEMAGYGTARSLAQRLGENQTAEILQQTLNEEGEANKKLTSIA